MFSIKKLENAYGIKKLDFSNSGYESENYLIYSPNGSMKTSLAKSIYDISKGVVPKDRVYGINSNYEIYFNETKFTNLAPSDIGNIIVFMHNKSHTYSIDEIKDGVQLLISNEELRVEFHESRVNLQSSKMNLLSSVADDFYDKRTNNREQKVEEVLFNVFHQYSSFTDIIQHIKDSDMKITKYDYKYKQIFNEKIINIISTDDFSSKLDRYLSVISDKLSSVLFTDQFGPQQAKNVLRAIEDNHFLEAGNSVVLKGYEDEIIRDSKRLDEIVQNEINKLFVDENVKESYDELVISLNKNKEARDFAKLIKKDYVLAKKLDDYVSFRENFIVSSFRNKKLELNNYYNNALSYSNKLLNIKTLYEGEITLWDNVIEKFNNTFDYPIKISIDNKFESMLGVDAPKFKFVFENNGRGPVNIQENVVKDILSTGELNVLAILYFLLDIEIKKLSNDNLILVIDDIIDSFDYKNKFALINYLYDMCENDCIQLLLMTHNFDFFRNLHRLKFKSYISVEWQGKTIIQGFKSANLLDVILNNSMAKSKRNIRTLDRVQVISLIPVLRNLVEFREGNSRLYKDLSKLLHYKPSNAKTRFIRYFFKYLRYLRVKPKFSIVFKPVYELVFNQCDQFLDLENRLQSPKKVSEKLILSIGIRLKAEMLMIKVGEIDDEFVNNITENQFVVLKKKVWDQLDDTHRTLVNEASIVSPGFIHVNSFMYEPLIDTSMNALISLYKNVSCKLKEMYDVV